MLADMQLAGEAGAQRVAEFLEPFGRPEGCGAALVAWRRPARAAGRAPRRCRPRPARCPIGAARDRAGHARSRGGRCRSAARRRTRPDRPGACSAAIHRLTSAPSSGRSSQNASLSLKSLRDLAPVRARDRGRAADRPPAGRRAERLGQQAEHVLDRGVGIVDPVVGQVVGHRDTVDIEDHPASAGGPRRSAARSPRSGAPRRARRLCLRICCCEILAPVLALASPSCGCSSRKAGEPLRG